MAKSNARFSSRGGMVSVSRNINHNLGTQTRANLSHIHDDKSELNLYNINGEWMDSKQLKNFTDDPEEFVKQKFVKELEPYKEQFEEVQSKHHGKNKLSWTDHINEEKRSRSIYSDSYIGLSADAYRDMGLMDYHYEDRDTGEVVSEDDYWAMDENERDKTTNRITDWISKDTDKWMDYVKAQEKMFKTNYKKAYGVKPNILAMELHLDETTPHIHVQLSYIKHDPKHKSRGVLQPYYFKNDNAGAEQTSNFQDLMEKSQRAYAEPKGATIEPRTMKFNTLRREQGWMNDKTYAVDKKLNDKLVRINEVADYADEVFDKGIETFDNVVKVAKTPNYRANAVYDYLSKHDSNYLKNIEKEIAYKYEQEKKKAIKTFDNINEKVNDENDDPKEQ